MLLSCFHHDFAKSQLQAAAWKVELPAAYRWGLGPVRYRRGAHEEASCKAMGIEAIVGYIPLVEFVYGMYPT